MVSITPLDARDDDRFAAWCVGHHLRSWVKVTNLQILSATVPGVERVPTWTDPANSAMQAVNARFGCWPVEVLHEAQRGSRAASRSREIATTALS